MNTHSRSQLGFSTLVRYTLLATCICYIPHVVTEPWWLFLIFYMAISYRLIADYFSITPTPFWLSLILVLGCLFLLYQGIFSSGFLVRFLLTFIILKLLEIHTMRDLKVLVLCNFFLIFSALIVIQELWIICYLLVAIVANLAVMLKLSASQAPLRQISGKSLQQLLIAIPLSILLFYFFPRIDPLWHIHSTSSKASIGFSDSMSPGSIAELYNNDSVVMHITFNTTPPLVESYWRGLILTVLRNESWYPAQNNAVDYLPLRDLNANEKSDYDILLEPHQKKWLFYTGYPVASGAELAFSPERGLVRQNMDDITQRFAYSLKVQTPPYHILKSTEYSEYTQLPNANPRLKAWAKTQFAQANNNVQAFINFLQDYITQQPFWYTLIPPQLNSLKNQMDRFWFESQKGYCEHYAGAVTFILRAAGIPARVILGYQGGEWNPLSHAVTIQQNNAHAWLEYWQQGMGWQKFDPTTFIALERIDRTIRANERDDLAANAFTSLSQLPWGRKIKLVLDSVRFFSERWFLHYNQNTQKNLLVQLGFSQLKKIQLLQISIGLVIIFCVFLGLAYQWWQKRMVDSLVLEYHLLQGEFRRFKISTLPAVTLEQQCHSLMQIVPALSAVLSAFVSRYEVLRLQQADNDSKQNKKETIKLFKALRYTLRRHKFSF